jgi:hypothetical protein
LDVGGVERGEGLSEEGEESGLEVIFLFDTAAGEQT